MLISYMESIGYTEENVIYIKNFYGVSTLNEETLLQHVKEIYSFLLKTGYKNEEIIKMTLLVPTIYAHTLSNIKKKIDDMISLGYTKNDILKMTKITPHIYIAIQ